MAIFTQLSGVSTSNGMDLPFKNYTGSDIPEGTAVQIDTGNVGDTNKPQGVITTAGSALALGIALTRIPAGGMGVVRVGGLAVAIAGAAVTVGASLKTNASGQVITGTAAAAQIGYAMTKADVATDRILILLAQAVNA